MISTRGAVCSPRVLQSTEGKNHSLPRSIYVLFFVRLTDFNTKKLKICKLLNLSVMLTVKNNFLTFRLFSIKIFGSCK
jgi:hypothetical protein